MSEKTAEVKKMIKCPICGAEEDEGWNNRLESHINYEHESMDKAKTIVKLLKDRESAPKTVKLVVCNEPENCETVKELQAMLKEAQRRLDRSSDIISCATWQIEDPENPDRMLGAFSQETWDEYWGVVKGTIKIREAAEGRALS